MTYQEQIDALKAHLKTAETTYAHAMAAGDWATCTAAKSDVAKFRAQIGKIIKANMKRGIF